MTSHQPEPALQPALTIMVISLDYDGCWMEPDFAIPDHKNVLASNPELRNQVLASNTATIDDDCLTTSKESKKIFQHILRQADSKTHSGLTVICGSNRTSPQIECGNKLRNNNGFAAPAFVKLVQEINESKPSIPVTHDKFLLCDAFDDKKDGHYCELICQKDQELKKLLSTDQKEFKQTLQAFLENAADCFFDKSKVILLYAQMHRAALTYSGSQVIFEFIDDNSDILYDLYDFFNKNKNLIPRTVKLKLTWYENREEDYIRDQNNNPCVYRHEHFLQEIVEDIQGTGLTNTNYKQAIKDLANTVSTIYRNEEEKAEAYDLVEFDKKHPEVLQKTIARISPTITTASSSSSLSFSGSTSSSSSLSSSETTKLLNNVVDSNTKTYTNDASNLNFFARQNREKPTPPAKEAFCCDCCVVS
jgi:hypothetical protein